VQTNLTTITVIGAIIILLQVMILISIWRRGSKYQALEKIYRQRQAEANAKPPHSLSNWKVDEEDVEENHDDSQGLNIQTALDEPPRA